MVWTANQRRFAEAVSAFVFGNPFHSETSLKNLRLATTTAQRVRQTKGDHGASIPEPLDLVVDTAAGLLDGLSVDDHCGKLNDSEFSLYQDLVLFVMYYRFRDRFQQTIDRSDKQIDYYDDFCDQWNRYWADELIDRPPSYEAAHVFACLFQIRRAHHHIDQFIWGESPAIGQLRATIWESIFTHDFRRYGLLLYDRMEEVTTLVLGPSGSGKELVARAIGMSRHIKFDASSREFVEQFGGAFNPVNISALPATLVESELFGHKKGAFTGASKDHDGWFSECQQGHSVFLDEIGELSPEIQVKLLRVVQNREFCRIGETTSIPFSGKLIVATNRDLGHEIDEGRFREDLYYRLCSDVIRTPSLREQVSHDPKQLIGFAQRIALQHLANEAAAKDIAKDAFDWIEREMGFGYEWPGNFRELEQCVWNVLIRKSYRPINRGTLESDPTIEAIRSRRATAAQVLAHYCAAIYTQTGSYAAAAKIVQLDQRTVKRYVLQQHD